MASKVNAGKILLSRDNFREGVFARDNNTCVICKAPAVDAHHILERKLFKDEGYYLNNGASLCSSCHLKAEMTILSVEEIREACGISEADKVIPEHLYDDQSYDKWSNPILPNKTRSKGELFDDVSVQRVLAEANVLGLFTKYVKYPRTWHLPWSPGATKDDRTLSRLDFFEGKEVVVTVKMDGENTTLYNDYIHARSLADKKHWSKAWIKNFHGQIAHDIPDNMRLVIENVYAEHSISYKDLASYCYGISCWSDLNCLDFEATLTWFELLGITPVPVLYRGVWDEKKIRSLYQPTFEGNVCEGYVVRTVEGFHYRDFAQHVAKFVRANHVTDNDHWFHGKVGKKNSLKNETEKY